MTWGGLTPQSLQNLKTYSQEFGFSIISGDLLLLNGGWYVTHTGLIRLARRKHCVGIDVKPVPEFSDLSTSRWAFKATVYRSRHCRGFVGYGDADLSNVSPLVHGAAMCVAETRAVNRALRKAYGIGICSVEEIGSFAGHSGSAGEFKKISQPTNGKGNYGGRTVCDRLCQLIRQNRVCRVSAPQRHPVSSEPVQYLPVSRPLPWETAIGRNGPRTAARSRKP